MRRWAARPSISAIRSSRGLRARNGLSGCPETWRRQDGHLLARSELPIDAVSLARCLIDKVLVRELPEGVACGRIIETQAYAVSDAAGHAYRGVTQKRKGIEPCETSCLTELAEHCLRSLRCALRLGRSLPYPEFISS